MSRSYEVQIEVEKCEEEKTDAVASVLEKWGADLAEFYVHPDGFSTMFQTTIGGGWSAKMYADEMAKEIFKAHGGDVEITITTTCLEDLPYDVHTYGKEEAAKLLAGDRETRSEE